MDTVSSADCYPKIQRMDSGRCHGRPDGDRAGRRDA